jgi:hypothetical protein
VPLKGRDIVSALAVIIADDLVRTVGVDRAQAARAATYIADAGEWWSDIMAGGGAVLGLPTPRSTPPVLLALVQGVGQTEPEVFIGSFESIQRELAKGDRFRAVSVTDAWATWFSGLRRRVLISAHTCRCC